MNRIGNIKGIVQGIFAFILPLVLSCCTGLGQNNHTESFKDNSIKIGLLYSGTGHRSISEGSLRDAAAMAVEEINNDGGLLGKQLELLVIDNESKDDLYKGSIVQLLNKHDAKVIFCTIPEGLSNYVAVKTKRSASLVFNLSNYIKNKGNSGIIRLGSSPRQLLYPGVDYLLKHNGGMNANFYIIGTSDFYSREANQVLQAYLTSCGVKKENITDGMIDVESENAAEIITQIKELTTKGKTFVLNTMNGKANHTFFKEFANQGLSALSCPIMSFSISEDEMRFMGAEFNIGHYFCSNYFQSMDTDNNIRFASNFKLFSAINELPGGIDRVTGENIAKIYSGIYLWRKAVEKAGTFNKYSVLNALSGIKFNSPSGQIQINTQMLTLDKPVAIAESNIEGQMTIRWDSGRLIPAFYKAKL